MKIVIFILLTGTLWGQCEEKGQVDIPLYWSTNDSTWNVPNIISGTPTSAGTVELSLGDDGDDSAPPSLPMWKCWVDEKNGEWKCKEDAELIMDTIQ